MRQQMQQNFKQIKINTNMHIIFKKLNTEKRNDQQPRKVKSLRTLTNTVNQLNSISTVHVLQMEIRKLTCVHYLILKKNTRVKNKKNKITKTEFVQIVKTIH